MIRFFYWSIRASWPERNTDYRAGDSYDRYYDKDSRVSYDSAGNSGSIHANSKHTEWDSNRPVNPSSKPPTRFIFPNLVRLISIKIAAKSLPSAV